MVDFTDPVPIKTPSSGWLDTTIASMKSHANGNEASLSAVRVIEENKDDLLHLGEQGLVAVITHLAAGNWDKATERFIKKHATIDELLEASKQSTEEVLKAHKARELAILEAKRAALRILGRIGVFTAKYILPLLIIPLL